MDEKWSELIQAQGMEQLAVVVTAVMRSTLPENASSEDYITEMELVVESFIEDSESFTDVEDAHNALESYIWEFYPEELAAQAMARLDDITLGLWFVWLCWLDLMSHGMSPDPFAHKRAEVSRW